MLALLNAASAPADINLLGFYCHRLHGNPTRYSIPARRPSHPGALLREDLLPAAGLTVTVASERLGISRQMLHGILAERHGITTETALRIGKLCGNGPEVWLRMQQAHDLWQAERDMAEDLARIPTLTAT